MASRWLILGDTQYPFHDPAAEKAALSYLATGKWRGLIHLGDFVDFYSLSRFLRRAPAKDRPDIREELEVARKHAALWSEAFAGPKLLLAGNHEERVEKYIESHAPELMGLPELSIPVLLQLRGWKYIGPYGKGVWVGRPGGLWATHGDYVRKASGASAKAHLDAYGHSVIHGHTHRLGAHYRTTRLGMQAAFETGCLCSFTETPPKHASPDWQHGVAEVETSDTTEAFHVTLHPIRDGKMLGI